MKCPLDSTELQMTDRQGIEIDYCPSCRGVWLDRGELDKLIERGSGSQAPAAPRQEYREEKRYDDDRYKHGKHHRRESFLGEIFDF